MQSKFNVKFYRVEDGIRDERIVTAKTPDEAGTLVRKEIGAPIHILKTKLARAAEAA